MKKRKRRIGRDSVQEPEDEDEEKKEKKVVKSYEGGFVFTWIARKTLSNLLCPIVFKILLRG